MRLLKKMPSVYKLTTPRQRKMKVVRFRKENHLLYLLELMEANPEYMNTFAKNFLEDLVSPEKGWAKRFLNETLNRLVSQQQVQTLLSETDVKELGEKLSVEDCFKILKGGMELKKEDNDNKI